MYMYSIACPGSYMYAGLETVLAANARLSLRVMPSGGSSPVGRRRRAHHARVMPPAVSRWPSAGAEMAWPMVLVPVSGRPRSRSSCCCCYALAGSPPFMDSAAARWPDCGHVRRSSWSSCRWVVGPSSYLLAADKFAAGQMVGSCMVEVITLCLSACRQSQSFLCRPVVRRRGVDGRRKKEEVVAAVFRRAAGRTRMTRHRNARPTSCSFHAARCMDRTKLTARTVVRTGFPARIVRVDPVLLLLLQVGTGNGRDGGRVTVGACDVVTEISLPRFMAYCALRYFTHLVFVLSSWLLCRPCARLAGTV